MRAGILAAAAAILRRQVLGAALGQPGLPAPAARRGRRSRPRRSRAPTTSTSSATATTRRCSSSPSDGVIATDPVAYGRPTGGQQYVDEIKKVTDKPIKYLIYSHHHFDHIAGGKAFKDAGATVIAHKNAKERLEVLQDPHTVIPDELVGNKKVIKLGGTTLELHYLGLNHSDSTLVMRLPKEKIIFVVDTIPVGSFPGRGMIDIYPLETEEFLKKVIAMDWERLIPGHPGAPNGRLGTKKDAQDLLALHAGRLGRDEEARPGRQVLGRQPRRSSSSRSTRAGRATPTACSSSRAATAACGAAAPEPPLGVRTAVDRRRESRLNERAARAGGPFHFTRGEANGHPHRHAPAERAVCCSVS